MNFYSELLDSGRGEGASRPVTAPGLLNAIVKDIWDEKHKGMIKVEYLMGEKNKKVSDWVRVMTPYGGNGYGNYWLPEIGTEVIVGFVNGNLNAPIVLGCLWNGKDQFPKGAPQEKNEQKTIMTKAGSSITFSDTKGKEKIAIKTPKELEITIDDEADTILMQDKGKKNSIHVDCKGGNVTVTAGTAISLKVGNKEVLKAEAGKVRIAAGAVEVDGTQSLKLKGQAASLNGMQVKVKADGELGLEASGITQLKGSMVKIN